MWQGTRCLGKVPSLCAFIQLKSSESRQDIEPAVGHVVTLGGEGSCRIPRVQGSPCPASPLPMPRASPEHPASPPTLRS